jgi:hypothetical protein
MWLLRSAAEMQLMWGDFSPNLVLPMPTKVVVSSPWMWGIPVMFVLLLVVIARKRHRYAALLVAVLAVALVVFQYWALQLPTARLVDVIR